MMDDAMGIKILESLQEEIKELKGELIIGETDIDFVLSEIENGDNLIIIDSSYFGITPGEVCCFNLKDLSCFKDKGYSLHQVSLVKILSNFSFLQVKGVLITIEAACIDFGIDLSEELNNCFFKARGEVLKHIKACMEEFSRG